MTLPELKTTVVATRDFDLVATADGVLHIHLPVTDPLAGAVQAAPDCACRRSGDAIDVALVGGPVIRCLDLDDAWRTAAAPGRTTFISVFGDDGTLLKAFSARMG